MTDVAPAERGPRIAVCIPVAGSVSPGFMYDLASLMGYTSATAVADGLVESLGLMMVEGTYVHRARQQLAEAALQAEADFILWLDSDMRFPRDLLLRLLVHNKGVVGINYPTRKKPPTFTAVKTVGWGPEETPERLVTDDDATGLEQVEALGFGAVLMRTKILHRLSPDGEWFWYDWLDRGEDKARQHIGEDVYFCKRLTDNGVDVFIDHDLSKQCGHTGTFDFTLAHANAFLEE